MSSPGFYTYLDITTPPSSSTGMFAPSPLYVSPPLVHPSAPLTSSHYTDQFSSFDLSLAPTPSHSQTLSHALPFAPAPYYVSDTPLPPTYSLSPGTQQTSQLRQFKGERQVSKQGRHSVLIYRIPGTQYAYTFAKHRSNKNEDVYRCVQCRKESRNRGEDVLGDTIKVVGDEFLTDPCGLFHDCLPERYSTERGTRAFFEELQSVRQDSAYATKKPVQIYFDLISKSRDADDEDMEDAIRAAIRKSGYQARRRQISQNLNKWVDRSVTMENVPREFRTLQDGSQFLQFHEPRFHIYYSVRTIEMALENGLYAIVADGVHTLHPKSLGYQAQLYCVHGVCNREVDLPLMFCITEKKTRRVYKKIFEHLKANLRGETPRRIVVDFEKAAIHAAKMVFPTASVECCAFHLAQAWSRKRNALTLKKYIQGPERDARFVKWWETLKGNVFLPQGLLRDVRALHNPPVPSDHSAYADCQEFLDYLRTTWIDGPFKGLWCKWGLEKLRTTNLAEAFHRWVQVLASVHHPPLSILIDILKKLNYEAKAALTRLKENPDDARALRRKHMERKAKISEEMAEFNIIYQRGPSQDEIELYCRRMSHYVTDKPN